MKKVILLTILMGTILAFVIFKWTYHEDINIVTLGDSLSLGYTAYHVKGYSFNDYLRDHYEENSHIEEYITEFSDAEETSQTLLLKLKNNYTIEGTNLSITQAIAKSKILTIAIGMYELNQRELNREDIEEYLQNMEQILKLIRIYQKKEVFLLSLYETDRMKSSYVKEINERLKELSLLNHMHYIDMEDICLNKTFFFNNKSYLINYKGHKEIFQRILKEMK